MTRLPPKWAGYAGVSLNLSAVQRERTKLFEQGLHCVGFWHSHPEPSPKPSAVDLRMAADHAQASKEDFTGLVFVIVGTAPPPTGLGVWVHDGHTAWQAELIMV